MKTLLRKVSALVVLMCLFTGLGLVNMNAEVKDGKGRADPNDMAVLHADSNASFLRAVAVPEDPGPIEPPVLDSGVIIGL